MIMIKIFSLMILSLLNFQAKAVEGESFPSTPNTYIVEAGPSAVILRGGTPQGDKDLRSLIDFGIKKILIFKNETGTEVQREIRALERLKFQKDSIIHISMPWRDFHSFKDQCEMTLQAMQEIEKAMKHQESLYFHCTVGEDRTGYLTALWKVWRNPSLHRDDLFLNEMCAKGYEGSNPTKPKHFVDKIRAYMTPLYLSMYELIRESAIEGRALKDIRCPDRDFVPDFETPYRCQIKPN